jgi:hypothetical protein
MSSISRAPFGNGVRRTTSGAPHAESERILR